MDIVFNKKNKPKKTNQNQIGPVFIAKKTKSFSSIDGFSKIDVNNKIILNKKPINFLRDKLKLISSLSSKQENFLKSKYKNSNFFKNREFNSYEEKSSIQETSLNYSNNYFPKIEKITLDNNEFYYKNKISILKNFDIFSKISLWKISLAMGIVCGMLIMTFWHYSFSEVVFAQTENKNKLDKELTKNEEQDKLFFSDSENFFSREKITDEKKKELEKKIREVVAGHPIENMLPYILEQDYNVAIYMIAIAKQESNWGDRVPVLNGKDCYNYWGYRENRDLMGSAGHTCFNSRKDAVETVGRRLDDLLYKYNRQTANKLIIWKCGYSCVGHNQEGVNNWINTVDKYYKELK